MFFQVDLSTRGIKPSRSELKPKELRILAVIFIYGKLYIFIFGPAGREGIMAGLKIYE